MDTLQSIYNHKIIAIARNVPSCKLLSVAEALYKGGIRLLEVTFDHKNANSLAETTDAIGRLCESFGDIMHIGAGTVLSTAQAEAAVNAGAKYIISPNFSPEVVAITLKKGAVSIPGAFTPTEIVEAHRAGAHIIKLFPAGDLGMAYIKSIMAPIGHIPMLATGGVNEQNMQDFLKLGMAGVGVGSGIVNNKLIFEDKFDELTRLAQRYTIQSENSLVNKRG